VLVVFLVMFLLDFPGVYFLLRVIVDFLIHQTEFVLTIRFGLLFYYGIMIIFTNYMLHIIMESNFLIETSENHFVYKTLLRKRELIAFRSIKKIIICKENIAFYGEYESIVIIRSGLKRSLFFQEFSMKKTDYQILKSILSDTKPEAINIKNKYYKWLLALLLY